MTQVWNLILKSLKQAFDIMADFELFAGLNLLQFLVICLVIDVCITLFFGHMPAHHADSALAGIVSSEARRANNIKNQQISEQRHQQTLRYIRNYKR